MPSAQHKFSAITISDKSEANSSSPHSTTQLLLLLLLLLFLLYHAGTPPLDSWWRDPKPQVLRVTTLEDTQLLRLVLLLLPAPRLLLLLLRSRVLVALVSPALLLLSLRGRGRAWPPAAPGSAGIPLTGFIAASVL